MKVLKDFVMNKLRKFYIGIFTYSKMSKRRLRTVKRMGCIFSIAGLRSKFLTQLEVKRASKMRRLFITKALITICCLFFLINLGITQNNSFQGTFLNQQLGLKLTLNTSGAIYSGQFVLQGQTFPLTAQLTIDNMVTGAYTYFGNQVPFTVTLVDAAYFLVSEGMTIPLTRTNTTNSPSANTGTLGQVKKITNVKKLPHASKTSRKANGQNFADAYSGYQFKIPTDWIGKQLVDGSYVIGHNTKSGFILVMPNQYTTLDQMYQESMQGIQEEGIQLSPSGEFQQYGKNGLTVKYEGVMDGQNVMSPAIGLLSPHGQGLTLLLAVRKDLYSDEYLSILQSIANTVTFSKPKVSPLTGQWQSRIKGKRLLYMKTENGFSDKIIIDLCSSGQFGYSSNSSGMSTGLSTLTYAGQDRGQGTWKIIGRGQTTLLILTYHNGEFSEYQLSNGKTNGQIHLNGRRYFIQNEGSCK